MLVNIQKGGLERGGFLGVAILKGGQGVAWVFEKGGLYFQ